MMYSHHVAAYYWDLAYMKIEYDLWKKEIKACGSDYLDWKS